MAKISCKKEWNKDTISLFNRKPIKILAIKQQKAPE